MDLGKYLPLSQRRSGDEKDVTGDRRTEIATVVREAHRLTGFAPARSADVLARSFADESGVAAGALLAADASPFARDDLLALAEAVETGGRRKVAQLARAVRAALHLADAVDRRADIGPLTLGAVALYASSTASFDRRAAVSGHTVVAVDADWRFGHGPELHGTAEGIVRFLLALSDEPPRAPAR